MMGGNALLPTLTLSLCFFPAAFLADFSYLRLSASQSSFFSLYGSTMAPPFTRGSSPADTHPKSTPSLGP